MAPPGKTEAATVKTPPPAGSAVTAPSGSGRPPATCPTAAEVEERCTTWMQEPRDRMRWQMLAEIAGQPGHCYDLVSHTFWKKFKKLSTPKAIEVITTLVQNMSPPVSGLQEEIVLTAIARETPEVRDAIEAELMDVPEKSLENGARDVDFYKKCLKALAKMREEECGTKDECYARHDKLFKKYRQYHSLTSSSLGFCYRTFAGFVGEQLSQSNFCARVSMDWLGRASRDGSRTMAGGVFTSASSGLTMLGARVGTAYESSMLYLEAGYVRLKNDNDTGDLVPIELADPPINSTRTAYNMRPHKIDRVFDGAYLALAYEGSHPVKKGSPFSFFYDITGGLMLGGVSDSPFSYAYDKNASSASVQPGADGNTVVQNSALRALDRKGKIAGAAMFGVGVGMRGTF